MASAWERTESGLVVCRAHALEQCASCTPAALVTATDDAPTIAAPDGCASTEEHERQFNALATKCEQLADRIPLDGADANGSTVVKLLDAAIKARRAASSLARAREDDAFVADLERKRAAMGKRGRH